MRLAPCVLLVLVLTFAFVLDGHPVAAEVHPNSGDSLPPVRAFKLPAPVAVDGLLNEAAWQRPPSMDRLTQSDPIEGGAPSESTWIWVAYDDDALYIAARLWDAHPESLVVRLSRRDEVVASDWLTLYLDPFHDHRTGYAFTITAAGVLNDGLLSNDGSEDDSWDGVWEGRVHCDRRVAETAGGSGWSCEVRVPFSQLRYRASPGQAWGVNVLRRVERHREDDQLVYRPRNGSGFVSRFPHLTGLSPGRRSRVVEVIPYTTGKAEYLVRKAGDPFNDGSRYTPGMGAELRTAVGSNLTLNATVNPDFGQVEVDPAVVNLSDVESSFSEKRPFFTEGTHIFGNFGYEGPNNNSSFGWFSPGAFYTRRIGRAPQGGVPGGFAYSDVPMATHILGAAKLTGKLTPSVSFGMVNAVTSREDARLWSGGAESRAEVEPLTYYGVARGLKEFKGGFNGLGAMTTLAQRRLDGSRLANVLNEQSLMTGLDGWQFLDRRKVWVLSGWMGMSRVTGTAARMTALQRNSRHYFQRPDVSYLGVDSSAASLTGYGGRLSLNKQSGNVTWNSAFGFLSPKYEVADVGYMSYADLLNAHTVVGYQWTKPGPWFKQAHTWVAGGESRDWGGHTVYRRTMVEGWARFPNDWSMTLDGKYSARMLNARRTRGGPLTAQPPALDLISHLDTNDGKKLFHCWNFTLSHTPVTGSNYWGLTPRLVWKPTSALSLEVSAPLEKSIEDAQYVTTVAAPGEVPADFGGMRYVFARLDQTTVSAGIRFNVCVTPNLSLQTYVQPLISAGRYTDFKELARSRSYDFIHYGSSYDPTSGMVTPVGGGTPFALGDPSFNFKSLRGNAMLRWEYRPGSVLYFVWTQDRTDQEAIGDLDFGPSARRLFDAQANDILLVKATYHLNL
jgi:hypothetical protein